MKNKEVEFARKARFLMQACGGPYSDQVIQEFYTSLKEAYNAGHTDGVMEFSIHGTDKCQACEHGRITTFVTTYRCTECQNDSH